MQPPELLAQADSESATNKSALSFASDVYSFSLLLLQVSYPLANTSGKLPECNRTEASNQQEAIHPREEAGLHPGTPYPQQEEPSATNARKLPPSQRLIQLLLVHHAGVLEAQPQGTNHKQGRLRAPVRGVLELVVITADLVLVLLRRHGPLD
ncbi:hypothetical protein FA13DRAFT_1317084 [Coprinellus micaceus]|uniref:Uncharacterized protein n=1 Tax=Coprinellus micaceus TaxID=71717 RepID=A0A4Y7SRP3_COPMI|nr:hypothetical protein FA13DRAFT_1317084 [Coprinellus micaceus]